ncbi:MAG: hypothetical protein EOM50_14065 [Erysipelotrichia bacterium]|nr:hypothetical protein [Erysipelotrichia bacterium]
MPFQSLEQALVKEIEHIKELFHKEELGEISIEDQAKNELLEIEKILQEQIEKSKRYSSHIQTEGDSTLEKMVKTMEVMRELVCKIEISAITQIKSKIVPRRCVCRLKKRKIKPYIEE